MALHCYYAPRRRARRMKSAPQSRLPSIKANVERAIVKILTMRALTEPRSLSRHALVYLHRGGVVVETEAFELAVQRRAADAQPPRHFRHLLAVMRDGEADDVSFYIVEW